MALPAGYILAKPAAERAERVAGKLYEAATTPLIRRETVKEVQDEDGNPKLIKNQVSLPAWLVAAAAAAALMGLQRGIRTGTLKVYYEPTYSYYKWVDPAEGAPVAPTGNTYTGGTYSGPPVGGPRTDQRRGHYNPETGEVY